jgi:hypothetical protein
MILLGSLFCYGQQTPVNPIAADTSQNLAAIPSMTRIVKNVNEVNLVLTVKKGKHLVDNLRQEDLNIIDNGHSPAHLILKPCTWSVAVIISGRSLPDR